MFSVNNDSEQDKWINVDKRTGLLVLRWRVKGFKEAFFLPTGLKDTLQNRALVRSKRDAIANDIALERFDATLETYRFNATRNARAIHIVKDEVKPKYEYDLQELWNKFEKFQEAHLEITTLSNIYRNVRNKIEALPTKSLNDAAKIRDWLLSNFSYFVAFDTINRLSQCCEWCEKSELIPDNPFEKLKLSKPKKPSNEEEDFRAFTLEQRDLIIEAFEKDSVYNHYADLVKFFFWTGCRPGEAFALTWSDINDSCTRVLINKSCNYLSITKGTKNGKKRTFATQPGSKLNHLLLDLQAKRKSENSLVFTTKEGKPITSNYFRKIWKCRKYTKNGREYYYPGVVTKLALEGKIPAYLNQYATRHTFATWAIASGITPEKVAKLIGDTVQTVLMYYVHPNVVEFECPDF
jgi:integrase